MEKDISNPNTRKNNIFDLCDSITENYFRKFLSGINIDNYELTNKSKNTKSIEIYENGNNYFLMTDKYWFDLCNNKKLHFVYATSNGKSKNGIIYSSSLMHSINKDYWSEDTDNKWRFFLEVIDNDKGIYLLENHTFLKKVELHYYNKKSLKAYESLMGPLNSVNYSSSNYKSKHPTYVNFENIGIEPNESITLLNGINEENIEELIDLSVLCRNNPNEFIKRMDTEINKNKIHSIEQNIKEKVKSKTKKRFNVKI